MCVKNVGRMDAYVRISAGLMMISLGIMKHRGWMAALGSMKVAEGITRYCPVLDALDLSTLSDEELIDDAIGNCVIDIEEDDDDYEEMEHECCCHHHDHETNATTQA
ncbi:DUF2892 domain-containing protein [Turicibacter sp. TJ11]|uniref:YgaP family membrane protein n=1 Tax=Turicibacter sp. TJ11 TaxID=2806443 RepID=UPI001F43DEC4|nr:DUF2892 domain-containing protein [Turicibacter sp. TJ11]